MASRFSCVNRRSSASTSAWRRSRAAALRGTKDDASATMAMTVTNRKGLPFRMDGTVTRREAAVRLASMSELEHSAGVSRRRWLMVAMIGVALVTSAMFVVALVIFAKEQFGGLVGSAFLPVITSGVLAGSIMVIVAALKLPERKSWRGIVLLVWGLVGLISPVFG